MKKKETLSLSKSKKKNLTTHTHPDHQSQLKQLNRVRGQLDGVEKMITNRRYCIDIINQLKAIKAGVQIIESAIFETHLKGCIMTAFTSDNAEDIQNKINEINKLVYGSKK